MLQVLCCTHQQVCGTTPRHKMHVQQQQNRATACCSAKHRGANPRSYGAQYQLQQLGRPCSSQVKRNHWLDVMLLTALSWPQLCIKRAACTAGIRILLAVPPCAPPAVTYIIASTARTLPGPHAEDGHPAG
eukprot:GHRQ01001920.1.p1 GENE.GHRQ01001920.1~~GHRQ01001920.1.p1  ORF type:complete len:131 (-),score=23.29 GHRQ01001920.1:1659-2051(-)